MREKLIAMWAVMAMGCSGSTDDGDAVVDAGSDAVVVTDSGARDTGTAADVPDVGCGGCAKGFNCSGGRCALNLVSSWIIRAVTGTASAKTCDGADWDSAAGGLLPDLQVCLTIEDFSLTPIRTCSFVRDNTLAATWNFDFPANGASDIIRSIEFEYFDNDAPVQTPICAKVKLALTETDFQKGSFTAQCACPGPGAGLVNFTLTAQ